MRLRQVSMFSRRMELSWQEIVYSCSTEGKYLAWYRSKESNSWRSKWPSELWLMGGWYVVFDSGKVLMKTMLNITWCSGTGMGLGSSWARRHLVPLHYHPEQIWRISQHIHPKVFKVEMILRALSLPHKLNWTYSEPRSTCSGLKTWLS